MTYSYKDKRRDRRKWAKGKGTIMLKDTVRSLSMFFLISIFSTKYLFSYNNIIIIRKPIH